MSAVAAAGAVAGVRAAGALRCVACDVVDLVPLRLGEAQLLSCRGCGAAFAAEMPDAAALDRYYERDYALNAGLHDLAAAEHRRLFRLPEQWHLLARLRALAPPPARLLDLGCDRAHFLDEARRQGYAVQGVEPSAAARDYAARIGIPVARRLQDVEGPFELIVLWHALEHVPDPAALLSALRALLRPGGHLVLRVPAFDSVWRRLFGARWIWFQPRNHHVHYSAAGLRALLARCGFTVLELRRQTPNDGLTRIAWRLACRACRRDFRWRPTLRRRIGQAVEHVTGVELYAVAQRPPG